MINAADLNLRVVRRFFAATVLSFSTIFGVSSANAQLFKTQTPPSNASANASQQERSTFFSGKMLRGFSDKTNDAAPTRPNGNVDGGSRSNVSKSASTSNVRVPSSNGGYSSNGAPRSGSNFGASGRPVRVPVASAPTSASSVSAPSTDATTDRAVGREVASKIPWNELSAAARQKLQSLTANPSIYRRLPPAGGRCNPELFDFLLSYPHTVVAFWNQMGFNELTMTAKGPNRYELREKTGTVANVQILYQDAELTLIYCNGIYRGPLIARPLEGEMALVLQTRYTEDETKTPIVVCRLDAFVDLKNAGADLLARTFANALGKVADSNFEQTVAFIDSLSQTAEANPDALIASIARLDSVSPDARRLLSAKTAQVARQARARAQGEYVEYRLLPKKNLPNETFARMLSRGSNGGPRATELAARPRAASTAARPTPVRSSLGAAPTIDEFDKPSLAANSFALANDVDATNAIPFAGSDVASDADADGFEATIDWNDASAENLGVEALKPTATSVAKATARTDARYADALELLSEDDATTPNFDSDELASVETTTLATDDALVLDGIDAAPHDETGSADVAIPNFAATASRLPALPTRGAKPTPLKASGRASEPFEAAPLAADDADADVPVLVLPDFNSDATDPTKSAATLKNVAPEVGAETEPLLFDSANETRDNENVANEAPVAPSTQSGPGVWRAVKLEPQASSDVRSKRVEKTARVESGDGVFFRRPNL